MEYIVVILSLLRYFFFEEKLNFSHERSQKQSVYCESPIRALTNEDWNVVEFYNVPAKIMEYDYTSVFIAIPCISFMKS